MMSHLCDMRLKPLGYCTAPYFNSATGSYNFLFFSGMDGAVPNMCQYIIWYLQNCTTGKPTLRKHLVFFIVRNIVEI